MTSFIALLRAVNVGGTGRLPMSLLAGICAESGFRGVKTYLASGNALFDSEDTSAQVKAKLEKRLAAQTGAAIGVLIRTAAEMREILAASPFPETPPNLTVAIFLDAPPPRDALRTARGQASEEMGLGLREIYVFYPQGQGVSKLRIPAATRGTARNMKTIAKLAEMASEA
jgi:uncharacterized protein (DUF1697 family)